MYTIFIHPLRYFYVTFLGGEMSEATDTVN